MTTVSRVLPIQPYASLAEYTAAGGGKGLEAARAVAPETIVEEIAASGLRGRGGAGFPTGVKWRTVRSYASPTLPTTVVINAAEGEPGTFKDRSIIRSNPYAVLEGALIAAHAVEARSIIVATKARFEEDVTRLRAAIAELDAAGWLGEAETRAEIHVLEGPDQYLYGEETALLEVIDGRPPFPRIAPPFRRGVDEVVATDDDVDSGSGLSATVQMAATDDTSPAPPVLVNNVETFANVPGIIANGAVWFRSVGTAESPGTIVCTLSGAVRRPGVTEVAMGTSLRALIEAAGGLVPGTAAAAVLPGVSNSILRGDQLDTALTYEAMASIGSGLGSAGFIVIDDGDDPVAVAAGASRFLAIESCGQCTPCKQDGLKIAELLAKIAAGEGEDDDLVTIGERLGTVADGARCSLARQHQAVVGSILTTFDAAVRAHLQPESTPVEIRLVAELVSIGDQGEVLDPTFERKQPDWTHDETDSGKTPVERFTDHRAAELDNETDSS